MDIIDLQYIRNLKEYNSISEFEKSLQGLLNSGIWFTSDDKLMITKNLVDRINNLKIEIYSNEHGVPHFHVKSNEISAVFSISDCSLLYGSMDQREMKLIKHWFLKCRSRLIDVWNNTRPTNCQIGPIDS